MQLHPVAALHLEGNIIAGMRHMIVAVAAAMIPSAYYSGIHCKPGAVVIIIPLLESAKQDNKEHRKKGNKKQRKDKFHNRKETKTPTKPPNLNLCK